ncbi:MAG: Rubrerythrin [Candidatus Proteinoplasmatales archaeon SG8-5]|nr:MAG: Rubrerythrin [Candidatus Proteinoplasmatales archaeon SG8-5]
MDLSGYSLEDIFLAAIMSEVESKDVYSKLAGRVRNAYLKDRLTFLATEEERHREYLIEAFRENIPGREPVLPGASPVPLPNIIIPDEQVPISDVLESAMNAELAAKDFYLAFARILQDPEQKRTLEYFAQMEEGHYNILKVEKENSLKFEDYDDYWPMMHVGP